MQTPSDPIDEHEKPQQPSQDLAENNSAPKKEHELAKSALEKLRDRIKNEPKLEGNDFGEKYINLRKRIRARFAFLRIPESSIDECVDKVIDRVARAIDNGAKIDNLLAYINRVAYSVFIDFVKPHPPTPPPEPIPRDPFEEQRAECLEECLKKLPAWESELILKYYQCINSRERESREHEEMASDMGISKINLYKRIERIRDKLRKCVNECLKKS